MIPSHPVRLVVAALAHLGLSLLAGGLLFTGHAWPAILLQALLAVVQTALILVFGTLPFPVRPSVLARMDFAAIDWLPHVAVTRLAHVRGTPGAHGPASMWRNLVFLAIPHLLLFLAMLASPGIGHPATWVGALIAFYGVLLTLAQLGRSHARDRGGLPPGSTIS